MQLSISNYVHFSFLLAIAITSCIAHCDAFALVEGFRSRAKADLIEQVTSGASNDTILEAIRKVERFSILGGADLKNPLLQGNWLMIWTTSNSIAGKTRPVLFQTKTPPEQLLDLENGRAINAEKIWGVQNAVKADLAPQTKNQVKVQFREFSVGPIKFRPDPDKFKGELSVTYLDEDMRISRGDLGNAFVLLRESTQRKEADFIWKEWRKSW
ncbi:unnamed protein product [Pseudo-nitzschia multistriata]|uniref:Plastid lipid-associated protein/fibrillin conserved domain-containing protein n=1 Tax=Pseudo-nitzschia multistriata TaxID=183589 RepID=A0A448ZS12_9STRA|nr:unnamed protein product [Pseudo-nitzschia multistriata]